MDNFLEINTRVPVVAVFATDAERLVCNPVKMRYHGKEIVFTELGLRHPTSKGKRMVHVFDVSDGGTDFRLGFDAESLSWTLVSMWSKGS